MPLKDGTKQKLSLIHIYEYETYKEMVTLNTMVPLWKKDKKDISEEEYNNFYSSRFTDMDKPCLLYTSRCV